MRHIAQSNYIIDIGSAFPSYPFVIMVRPIHGNPKIIDLNRPSGELSFTTNISINFQPNLLQWSDLMQAFVSTHPSSNATNTNIAFLHAKYFPQPRILFTGSNATMCLSMGTVHPYLLVGCADGSALVL